MPKLVTEACFTLSWNPPLHKMCVDSLTDVIQAIVTALDAGLNSSQICVQIRFCKAVTKVEKVEKVAEPKVGKRGSESVLLKGNSGECPPMRHVQGSSADHQEAGR
jgi:hypothetical protein